MLSRSRMARWLALAVVAALLWPVAAVALALWVAGWGTPGARGGGQDAVWLGHAWVDGRRGDADVTALVARIGGTGRVRDLFVHTGPLADDGTLDAALHPRAGWAVESLRAALPGVRVQAWLGQRVDPGRLDLDDAATRENVLRAVDAVLRLGFDGVHYNFEPTPDGSRGLLTLLDATRAVTAPRDAVLSLSSHHVDPLPGASHLDDLVIGRTKWWSATYLTEVARRVDRIAIMSYDTALPTAALYTGYVRRQTEVALDAVPDGTDLLIGVPAYDEPDLTHRPSAETVAAAVRGVRLALGPHRPDGFGIAVYVDFTATEDDWRSYRDHWAG